MAGVCLEAGERGGGGSLKGISIWISTWACTGISMATRVDRIRHFGRTTAGLYAMYTGGEANGGFHFAVPLPQWGKSRSEGAPAGILPDGIFGTERP
ncbi:MAG: hypothetical protein ACLR6J_13995 [Parabacteroides merdae]